jgi:hypothetical protein
MDTATPCDTCAASKCCTEWLACAADQGDPDSGINQKCADVWKCVNEECDAGTVKDCVDQCNTDFNPAVSEYYTCVYVTTGTGCASECQ